MTDCEFYLAGYCELQREHFCEYTDQQECPNYSPQEKLYSPNNVYPNTPVDNTPPTLKGEIDGYIWEYWDRPFKQI